MNTFLIITFCFLLVFSLILGIYEEFDVAIWTALMALNIPILISFLSIRR